MVAEGDRRQRIVVPEGPLRSEICKFFHEKNGHPDVHRIINAVTSYFFWPSMHKEIRAFVGSCPACQAAIAIAWLLFRATALSRCAGVTLDSLFYRSAGIRQWFFSTVSVL